MSSTATHITVRVPLAIRARPGRKTVVIPTGEIAAAMPISRADPALLKALARAFRYGRLLDEGRYGSISEMAEAEGIERGYLGTLLRLALLAPALIERIINGQQSAELTLPRLLEPLPADWSEQRGLLGNSPIPNTGEHREAYHPHHG
jgi:hypothetical protein